MSETRFASVGELDNFEILRVTNDGDFIWVPNAIEILETGNHPLFQHSPGSLHLLRALWVVKSPHMH